MPKLITYNGGGYRYELDNGKSRESGVLEGEATIMRGDLARSRYWWIRFRELYDLQTQTLIINCFPVILSGVAYRLKPPQEIYKIAIDRLRVCGFLDPCYCGGKTDCHDCRGVGYVIPQLTDEYLTKIHKANPTVIEDSRIFRET